MSLTKKDNRALIKQAEALGFRAGLTSRGHLRFTRPGCPPIFSGGTPGDVRANKNALARLRRAVAQLNIDPRKTS